MKTAFIFPGQGSQSLSMLSELAEHYPQVATTFDEASSVLDYDLWALTQNGPEEKLNQTDKTQPAMLAAGIAVWRVWQAKNPHQPAYLAGHSLGEYSALVASGVLNFQDAVRLVEKRGQFMQQAVPAGEGAMAAILGLDDEVVIALCAEAAESGVVEAVNFNSPGQVVIAGATAAVNKALQLATDKGAKRAVLLPVSVPSHCVLMQPAADKLAVELAALKLNTPQIPVIHNASVTIANNADDIRQLLAQQLYSPVRWVETIQWLAKNDVGLLVECGPGKVLAGLVKRIDKSLISQTLFDPNSLEKTQQLVGEMQ